MLDAIDRIAMWKIIATLIACWPAFALAELVPDAAFGSAGTVDIEIPGETYTDPASIAVLPDRRILVARVDSRPTDPPSPPALSIARLLPDGSRIVPGGVRVQRYVDTGRGAGTTVALPAFGASAMLWLLAGIVGAVRWQRRRACRSYV